MIALPKSRPDNVALRAIRLGLGLEVAQIAALAGVTAHHWESWETGARNVTETVWPKLRKALTNFTAQTRREMMKPAKPKKPDKTPVPPDIVKMHREVAQLTRDQAAAVVGVTPRAWQAYELGTRNMPKWMLDRFDGILTGRLDEAGNPLEYVPPPPPTLAEVMTQTLHARPAPRPMPTLPEIAFRPPTPKEEKEMADAMFRGLKMSEAAVRKAQKAELAEQERLRVEAEKQFGKPSEDPTELQPT